MPTTYLLKPSETALIVVDMTNDFLDEGSLMEIPLGHDIMGNLRRLLEHCRAMGSPVIYVRNQWRSDGSDIGRIADVWPGLVDDEGRPRATVCGTRGADVHPDLEPVDGDIIVDKHRQSAFFEREMDSVLRGLGVRTVLITGMATNGCCYQTGVDASFRGYEVVFLSDCTATLPLPDMGFGAFSADVVQRVTLGTFALVYGEVASTAEVLARLAAPTGVASP